MEKLTSRRNPVCIHLKKLGTGKSYRDEQGLFICEGHKMLDEAVKNGAVVDVVLSSKKIDTDLPQYTRIYFAENDLINSISQLKSTPGLLFSCRKNLLSCGDYHSGTHLLLDDIQDPGNAGTILRSASAFGIKTVIFTEGSADVYNPKSVRASMGAIFRQPSCVLTYDEIYELKKSGIKFIGASNESGASDIRNVSFKDSVIIIGNEGRGLSGELRAICNEMVSIPLSPGNDSLNAAVAASILMWEAMSRV